MRQVAHMPSRGHEQTSLLPLIDAMDVIVFQASFKWHSV